MECWYCYWGWPKKVADIYLQAVEKLDGYENPLLFGDAHVVWEDENFNLAESCLIDFGKFYYDDYTEYELSIVKWSLEELAKIPIEERCIEPDEYEGEHPELYPPKCEVVKVR